MAEAAAQACGKVTVANMNWQSAEVLANIDDIILTKGYGCEVELVPGDTMPTLTAMMEKGQPDVAPEAWVNAVRQPLDAAVKEGKLHYGALALKDGGVEGWWIPKYVADANPDIKTIDDALKHPELFPSSENKGKGAVHNCPSGWNCQLTTANAFKAWEGEKNGFVLLDTGSAAGLDGSIAKAYERKEGWLGYYWAPTSILGKYEMVKLDAGVPHDKEAWETCNCGGRVRQAGQERLGQGRGLHRGHRPLPESRRPCCGLPEDPCLGQRHGQRSAVLDERQPGHRCRWCYALPEDAA